MILADTSVWVDFFKDVESRQTLLLRQAIVGGDVVIGDLILVEILQGLKFPMQIKQVSGALARLEIETLCGSAIAPLAAENYRRLRRGGLTVRGTIDIIIATWCIVNGVALLHSDRDFLPMERHLGLVAWR